ncbi:MAG: methyltransferase domain-containing protein [Patescibacteria group bacterium]
MNNFLVRVFGYYATIVFGDSAVTDRWFWLRRNLRSGNLRTLDAGCGSGSFALYAARRGNIVVGISFDEQNNRKATERAKILKLNNIKFITEDLGRLGEMANDLGLFDQIICFETIEHILKDRKLVGDFSNLLKPGGRLLLTAPYLHYDTHLLGDDKFELSTYDASGNLLKGEPGGHVRLGYNHEQLEEILSESNLEVIKKDYITGFISQCVVRAIRVVSGIISPKVAWAITFPMRILPIFDGPITSLLRRPYLSVGIVAKKKQ